MTNPVTNSMTNPHLPLLMIVEDSDEDYEATLRALRGSLSRLNVKRCVRCWAYFSLE